MSAKKEDWKLYIWQFDGSIWNLINLKLHSAM